MIGLFIIFLVMGGSLLGATVLLVGCMFWTGRLALPGSEAHRLQHARNQEKIAQHEARAAEFRFQRAQAETNRQLLEAKGIDELQKLHDAHFRRELEAGEINR
jgi:hypothetical protein